MTGRGSGWGYIGKGLDRIGPSMDLNQHFVENEPSPVLPYVNGVV